MVRGSPAKVAQSSIQLIINLITFWLFPQLHLQSVVCYSRPQCTLVSPIPSDATLLLCPVPSHPSNPSPFHPLCRSRHLSKSSQYLCYGRNSIGRVLEPGSSLSLLQATLFVSYNG